VHKEVGDIKSCRANIFVGTLGLLGAVGVAILGILGAAGSASILGIGNWPIGKITKSAAWQNWLPLAALIPVALLTSAISATIHKARKINMRRGYLEALGEYLTYGVMPRNYCGWTKAKLVLERCERYLRSRYGCIDGKSQGVDCELREVPEARAEAIGQEREDKREEGLGSEGGKGEVGETGESESGHSAIERRHGWCRRLWSKVIATLVRRKRVRIPCLDKARDAALKVTREIDFWPPFLHSFTSLSTYVYGCAYVVSVVAFLWAMMSTIRRGMSRDFSEFKYWGMVVAGTAATLWVAVDLIRANAHPQNKSKFADWRNRYLYFTVIIIPVLFLGLVFSYTMGRGASLKAMAAYGFGGIVSAMAVVIGYRCCSKVHSLRRGKYSTERYRHVWKLCFEKCPLMGEETEPLMSR
jgi:hypothetical protein